MLQVFCRYSVMSLCASRCLADLYWSISKIWSPSGSWKISRSNAWLEDDSDIVFLQIFKLTSQAISWRVDLGRFWMKAVTVGCDRGKLGQRKPCRAGVTVLIHWFWVIQQCFQWSPICTQLSCLLQDGGTEWNRCCQNLPCQRPPGGLWVYSV